MMRLKMKNFMAAWFFSVFLIFASVVAAHAYSSILAFGDSLSDNGYYEYYPGGTPGNTNPADIYGFQRYSNGPVWVEYLAEDMGLSLLDMAYGGATSGWDNPAASSATGNAYFDTNTGLQWQVDVYQSTYGTIAPGTLITLWAGGNDMFNFLKGMLNDPYTEVSMQNFINGNYNPAAAAANIGLAIETLISLGGSSFIIPNLGITNSWIEAFDDHLAGVLASLQLLYPEVDIYALDMNFVVPPDDWIPAEDGTYLNPNGFTGTFVSWDGTHPTTESHAIIAAAAKRLAVPEPASIILMVLGFAGLIGLRRRIK